MLPKNFSGILHLYLFILFLFRHHVTKNIANGDHAAFPHIQVAAFGYIVHLYLDILFFQSALFQLFPNLFPGQFHVNFRRRIVWCFLLLILLLLGFVACIPHNKLKGVSGPGTGACTSLLSGNDGLNNFFLGDFFRHTILLRQLALFGHTNSGLHQISHHGVYVSSHVSHFRELSGFHLYKRGIHQPGQATGNFCFPHTGGPHH